MITMAEKRLQEVERKLIEQASNFTALQNKFDEGNTYPKMNEDLKEVVEFHVSAINSSIAKTNNKHDDLFARVEKMQKSLSSQSQTVEMLGIKSINLEADLQGHTVALSDLKQKLTQSEARNNLASEQASIAHERSLETVDTIKGHTREIQSVKGLANNAQIDATNALSTLSEYEKRLDGVRPLLRSSLDVQNIVLTRATETLHARIDDIPTIIPRSYDAELAELRNSMATLLATVHVTAPKAPDDSQINDKIKTLETAIAQIYSLLKKYER